MAVFQKEDNNNTLYYHVGICGSGIESGGDVGNLRQWLLLYDAALFVTNERWLIVGRVDVQMRHRRL